MNDGMITNRGLARRLTMAAVVTAMIVGLFSLGMGVASAATPNVTTSTGGAYTALATPTRIVDTRAGSGFPNAGQTMAAGGSIVVQLPASVQGTAAVALNVTAVSYTGSGFFTVYPTGGSLPVVSSMNFTPDTAVPNFVIVPVGTNNQVTIYNGPAKGTGGSADAVVDLLGSFSTAANTSGGAGHFNPVTPARITDTRAGSGQPNAGKTIGAGQSLTVQVTGAGGVPATGVSAVVLNVTEADNTAGGFLTAYPQGTTAPIASNLNFLSGQIVANRVIVPVSASGQINILNHAGNTDVVVDANGYFSDSTGSPSAGSLFNPVPPARVVDTRNNPNPIGPAGNLTVPIAGSNGIPATGTTAAVLNITEPFNTSGGFLTVSPTAPAPLASDVNFVPGLIVANGDVAALSSAGSVNVFNHAGGTDVILDVAGYFTPAPTVVTGSVVFSPNTGAAGSTVTGTVTNPASVAGIAITGCGVSQVVPASAINQTTGVFTFVIPIGQAAGSCSLAFASLNADGTSTTSWGPFTVTGPVTNQTYTVTPGTTTTKPITAPGQPITTASTINAYSASGLPTTGMVSIHLFPCTASGAPTTSSGTTTFTAPGGTTPVAGQAVGDGTTDTNSILITTVNGTPITPSAHVDNVTPSGGGVTFTLNTTAADCGTPVVFADTTANTTGGVSQFQVSATGTPSEAFGVGGKSNYIPAEAPAGVIGTTVTTINTAGSYITTSTGTYYYASTDTYQLFTGGTCVNTTQSVFLSKVSAGDHLQGIYGHPLSGTSTFCLTADHPLAPATLTATPQTTSTQIKLAFPDSATPDVVSYNIYRNTVGTVAGNCPLFAAGTGNPFTLLANTPDTDPTTGGGAAQSYTDSATTAGTYYCYAVTSVSSSGVEGGFVQNPNSGAAAVHATPTPAATTPLSVSTAEQLPGPNVTTLVSGDALQVTFNQAVAVAPIFSLTLTDGTNTGTITNANATAALSNTNQTVTYTLTATPFSTPGSLSVAHLEALSQSGVSDATGQWNLPGSATDTPLTTNPATAALANPALNRVFGGTNTTAGGLGTGPTIGAITDGAPGTDSVVAACVTGDTVNLYDAKGNLIGIGICVGGTVTIAPTSTIAIGDVIGATEQPAGGFESFESNKAAP
jgi:hypothetical protein